MPNLHVIIGDPDTRKSSLMRCLTGVRVSWLLKVAIVGAKPIEVYCKPGLLQEGTDPIGPADFIAEIGSMKPVPTDVLIALRVRPRVRHGITFPGATGYLTAFAARRGWVVSSIALLGTSAGALGPALPAGTRIASVPASGGDPTNASAAFVRKVWGWV